VTFRDTLYLGSYQDFATGARMQLAAGATLELPAWGYRVFVK
jgi:hypothetical protein